MRTGLAKLVVSLVALGFAGAAMAAGPFSLSYMGRMADATTDKAVDGPVDIEVKFFRKQTGGSAIGVSPVAFSAVKLVDGVFQIDISSSKLSEEELHEVFASNAVTWVEVKDVTHGVVYPRQTLMAVPFALKVPVDGKTLGYTAKGEMTLKAGSGSSGDVLTLNGDGTLSWDTPSSASSSMLTKPFAADIPASGEVLKYNGTAWVAEADKGIEKTGDTGIGNLALAATKTLGLGTFTDAQETAVSFAPADEGKAWYNSTSNQIKMYNGTSVVALGAAGSGLADLNGAVGSTQNLAVTTPGGVTAPDWSTATNTHTLRLPIASNAGVTAGLISKADYDAFNNKQDALSASSNVTVNTMLAEGDIKLDDDDGSASVTLKAKDATTASYTLVLPDNVGSSLDVLQTDGTGALSWVPIPSAPVTSVNGDTGAVVLDAADIAPTATRLWLSDTDKAKVDALGTLANLSAVTSGEITDGTIVAADIANGTISDAKLATIATGGKVSGSAITGTIGGSTVINTSGAITSSGTVTAGGVLTGTGGVSSGSYFLTGDGGEVKIKDTAGGQYVSLKANGTTTANYTLTLPPAVPANNQVLTSTDTSGTMGWATMPAVVVATGSAGDIQFNNAGAFSTAASQGLAWQSTPNRLVVKGLTANSMSIGNLAGGSSMSGTGNTSLGSSSGAALSSGADNTLVGFNGGSALTTGNLNTAIGKDAGRFLTAGASNTFLGALAGDAVINGNNNVFIGSNADSTVTTVANAVAIGSGASADGNGAVAIGQGVVAANANEVVIGTPGGNRLTMNASGMVGIGTTAPASTLDVNGGVRFKTLLAGGIVTHPSSITMTANDSVAVITGASGNITLPTCGGGDLGRVVWVKWASAGSTISVTPATGAQIDTNATNASINITPNGGKTLICVAINTWATLN